jgi:tRNA nucleotidyltransferase/poly(A) polymerase
VTSPAFRILLHHPAVRTLASVAGGTECHLVGGILRDKAMGLASKDIDAVVSGRGLEIAEELAKALPARFVLLGGKEFAAYRLVAEDVDVDLWDRAGTTLYEDLARRDFTLNSIALDLRTEEVADPFDGLGDLARRLLRATTPESFTGDPLRVLRLPRMLIRLPGFAADPDTLVLARRSSARIVDVAAERVRDELSYLFAHPDAHLGVAMLVALDLYPGLWLGTPGEPGRPGGAVTELEALPGRHLELREIDPEVSVDVKTARWAATFAHLPGDSLERVRDAGYIIRAEAAKVAHLLSFETLPDDETGRRRFLHRAGPLWATVAVSLGARSEDLDRWRSALRSLADLARREGETLFEPPRLLTGGEVQELLGIPAGPKVGEALSAVRQAQVDGRIRTREEAVALVSSALAGVPPAKPSPGTAGVPPAC